MRPTLRELFIVADPSKWAAVGFDIRDTRCQLGTTTLCFVDPTMTPTGMASRGAGIVGWSLLGVATTNTDGVHTRPAIDENPPTPVSHDNGSTSIDHVVMMTPDMGRTQDALATNGLELRRVRDVPGSRPARQQAFYRLGEVILEVVGPVEPESDDPASLWGLVTVVDDIDAAASTLGNLLGTPRDAVQPGRRIATMSKAAGLGVPLAFLSEDP